MGWSEERVALLRKLWAEGLSASQIAKQLGGVTRNAVIGKVHRLGLAGRATPSRPAKRPVRTARPRVMSPSAPRLRMPSSEPRVVIPDLVPVKFEGMPLATAQPSGMIPLRPIDAGPNDTK